MEKYLFRVGSQENMKPMLMSGDEIACIKVGIETLKYYGGYIHYIEFIDGQTTIRRVEDVGDSIKIKCDGDGMTQTIPKEYVQAIYRVIASARRY